MKIYRPRSPFTLDSELSMCHGLDFADDYFGAFGPDIEAAHLVAPFEFSPEQKLATVIPFPVSRTVPPSVSTQQKELSCSNDICPNPTSDA